ncbi:MAG: radical SAM protein [Treponema sp.]|jgi:radical SAM protein with 4Fe4S-binding SPASM domain|nr:radical SAM protein [Treponema sp.]
MPRCNKKTVSFLLTTRCNLNCTYCYGNRKADYKTLDFKFAERVLRDYVEKEELSRIRFSADGEPTTEMELLKKIFHEAKRLNPDVLTEVITNGTFNEDTARWLAENLDFIYISADLLPESHDKCRFTITETPSSPPILRNLEFFQKMAGKRAKIGLCATITKYNIEQQKEAIDFYYDNFGVDIFWVTPVFTPVYEADEKICESIDMTQFARSFVDAHTHAWTRGVFYESSLTANFDGETLKACCACVPMPYLTVDGYLSACKMAAHGKTAGKMDSMIYARYDTEKDKIVYDAEKIKILRSRTLQSMPSQCGICAVGKHCAGYCPGEALNENIGLFRAKTGVCRAIRYIYGEIGHLYDEKFGAGGFPYSCP